MIAYFVAMIFCGIPIFFQEVALGQYLGAGGMTLIGQLVPIMKGMSYLSKRCLFPRTRLMTLILSLLGVGFATMVVVVLIDIYYTIIISWTLFYLVASFTALPSLPWAGCSKYFPID